MAKRHNVYFLQLSPRPLLADLAENLIQKVDFCTWQNIIPSHPHYILFNFVFMPLYHCGTMVRSCFKMHQNI